MHFSTYYYYYYYLDADHSKKTDADALRPSPYIDRRVAGSDSNEQDIV